MLTAGFTTTLDCQRLLRGYGEEDLWMVAANHCMIQVDAELGMEAERDYALQHMLSVYFWVLKMQKSLQEQGCWACKQEDKSTWCAESEHSCSIYFLFATAAD